MARHWTKAEKQSVFHSVGSYGWSSLQSVAMKSYDKKAPVRSVAAVKAQVRRMCDSGIKRGSTSLHRLATDTGYTRKQLRRAQKALNQKWIRSSRRGSHLISFDQVQDLVAWLAHDFWAPTKKLYSCLWCSTSTKKHRHGGLCCTCVCTYRRKCLAVGLPASLAVQREILEKVQLSCEDLAVHGKFLEESKRVMRRGLALSRELLDWYAVVYTGPDFCREVSHAEIT